MPLVVHTYRQTDRHTTALPYLSWHMQRTNHFCHTLKKRFQPFHRLINAKLGQTSSHEEKDLFCLLFHQGFFALSFAINWWNLQFQGIHWFVAQKSKKKKPIRPQGNQVAILTLWRFFVPVDQQSTTTYTPTSDLGLFHQTDIWEYEIV